MKLNDKYRLTRQENLFLAKKMLVSCIYSSARLENVNVTFPDTQTILDGISVPNMPVDDIQTILNLRNGWKYALEHIGEETNLNFMCKINSFVSYNESLDWGCLRTGEIGISGTNWKPPVPQKEIVEEYIEKLLKNSNSSTEKAISLFIWGMKNQNFWDGNKRTSLITANHYMIANGAGILIIPPEKLLNFNCNLTEFYDSGESDSLKIFLYDNCVSGMERDKNTIIESPDIRL
ncbi:MAG: Fic family protein [Synergistaceae bacterium]|nr:Fic family protein [Synergistaceae bacterium]